MITKPAKRLRKFDQFIIGSSTRTELEYIEISEDFPWFCLSNIDQNITTANYPIEFINKRRNLKYIYNEFNSPLLSPRAESFSGAWASNVFTLNNNAANVAMITELAEDWLYHGSPTSNWRILRSNNQDYNITGITVATRQITVNIDGSATSGTSIEIFTNRVYRQATQARHFSEAGLATYQAGGGKSGRLFRRDENKEHKHLLYSSDYGGAMDTFGLTLHNALTGRNLGTLAYRDTSTMQNTGGSENLIKSSSDYRYIYVGSYTA